MFVEKEFDKPYPEPPECEVNERDCTFDADGVCHECGDPVCSECAIGVRHQPHLAKYLRQGVPEDQKRVQLHCPECLEAHSLNTELVAGAGGGILLGLLLLFVSLPSNPVVALIGLALLAGGGYLLYHEYRLKERLNDNYGPLSLTG